MLNKYFCINGNYINISRLPKHINTLEDIINNFGADNSIHNNYYILINGKIVNKYTNIDTLNKLNDKNIIYIDIIERQCGGGGIEVIFNVIIDIGKLFLMLYKFIKFLGLFIFWLLKFIAWLFTDLLNPVHFFRDFFNTLMILVISICKLPFDIVLSLMALSINTVGGWMQGFWGWDQSSLTKADKDSNYFKKINRVKGLKCYLTNTNTVPFSIILGTILCPPIGVFMDMGLTGWLNIIICILLTLLFYIPGLVYALLIIYS
jgi:uncharacterized membrane protein YqaE (UPF0057 family)